MKRNKKTACLLAWRCDISYEWEFTIKLVPRRLIYKTTRNKYNSKFCLACRENCDQRMHWSDNGVCVADLRMFISLKFNRMCKLYMRIAARGNAQTDLSLFLCTFQKVSFYSTLHILLFYATVFGPGRECFIISVQGLKAGGHL